MLYSVFGAFGGAPCAVRMRVRSVPKWAWRTACNTALLWLSVELPAGPWGHETCKRCAEMGGGTACSTTFLERSVELRGDSTCA